MKVTVLLAVHNGDPYLGEAIEDTLAQTFEDFEFLVVDDASTDGTEATLASYADPRLRVIRNEENIGQAPSLNRGLAEAQGEYVARIDADDRMLPKRLERQVALLDGEPHVALAGTWVDVVDEDGRLWSNVRGDIRDFVDLLAAILLDRYPFAHPSLMYRRDVVRELGGYDATLAPAEDKDLYRRLALARREVRVICEPLVRYRRHEAQLSQAKREHQLSVDHEGQERFLAEIVGADHARQLRNLLATGGSESGSAPALLDELLERAEARLSLSGDERRRLERILAAQLTRRALGAGRAGAATLAWTARSEPLARAARALLPLSPPIRFAGRAVRRSLDHPRLDPLRRHARRSRLLRMLYSRLG
jgi:hypothetical protein